MKCLLFFIKINNMLFFCVAKGGFSIKKIVFYWVIINHCIYESCALNVEFVVIDKGSFCSFYYSKVVLGENK